MIYYSFFSVINFSIVLILFHYRAIISKTIVKNIMKEERKQIKSKNRVTKHGEVFTGEREVKAMCDLVSQECDRIDSRFLDQTTPNMIQGISGIFERNPLISKEI